MIVWGLWYFYFNVMNVTVFPYSVAALMAKKVKNIEGKNVVAVISGGNVDVNVISQVIETGLMDSGRRVKIEVNDLPDRPGALADLISITAKHQANVVSVQHERKSNAYSKAKVAMVLDVRDFAHADGLIKEMNDAGYTKVDRNRV